MTQYLGLVDIVRRWIYTRQGVYVLIRRKDFPAPVITVNNGRTKIWLENDIDAYERGRPELFNKRAKWAKQFGKTVRARRAIERRGRIANQPDRTIKA